MNRGRERIAAPIDRLGRPGALRALARRLACLRLPPRKVGFPPIALFRALLLAHGYLLAPLAEYSG